MGTGGGNSEAPHPSALPVQTLRVRYAKRGPLRWTSHRDVARAVERAVRSAGLPMAYSQGFSPHPKISWAGAAPTGCASEAEYLELRLVRVVDPEAVRRELDAALPTGLAVLEVVPAEPGSLAERLEASRWSLRLPGVDTERLRAAVRALLDAPSVPVQRLTKDGPRPVDARAAVVHAHVPDPSPGGAARPCGTLVVVVRQVSPAVRPDDVLSALGVVAGLELPVPATATRTAQGRLDDAGGLTDPLAADRAPALPAPPGAGELRPGRDDVAVDAG